MNEEIVLLKFRVTKRQADCVYGHLLNGFGQPEELVHASVVIPLERLEGEKKPSHRKVNLRRKS